MHIQIDVIAIGGILVSCNLYTGQRCVRVMMYYSEYESLIADVFIRDGKEVDSAGVLNTSQVFIPELKH